MPSLDERVYRTILRHGLLPPGARVVVALSGGADSTALACLLVALAPRVGFEPVAAAHYNHRLRGAASDGDEAFSRALAERLGLTWSSGSGDPHVLAAEAGTSLEDAGRRARYDFLRRTAVDHGADRIAVGHTLDDQAETTLLQMLRGAGPRGLRAMVRSRTLEPASGHAPGQGGAVQLIRPLLECTHEELVGWLRAHDQPYREDESNLDPRFARNRVRHELIPLLRSRFSPGIVRVLGRNADIANADAELLESLADAALSRLSAVEAGRVRLDLAGLMAEPEAIRRRVVLAALGNLQGSRFVGFDQVERVLLLAAGARRGPIALPAGLARVSDRRLVLEEAPARGVDALRQPGMNFSRAALSIPGEVRLAGTGWRVSSSLRLWEAGGGLEGVASLVRSPAEAVVDASRATDLAVRTRRRGDWLRPLGLGGRKKLQDYFVDRKVPRDERDRVPLVVDGRDRIVWVAGHGIDEEFRVRGGTHDVVILSLRGESA